MYIEENVKRKEKIEKMGFRVSMFGSAVFLISCILALILKSGFIFVISFFATFVIVSIGEAITKSTNQIPIWNKGSIITHKEDKNEEEWNQKTSRYEILKVGKNNFLVKNLETGQEKEISFKKQKKYKMEEVKELPEAASSDLNKFINSKVKDVV